MSEGSRDGLAAATAAVAAANALWGFNYISTKTALAEIDSFALLLLRFLLVTPLLWLVVRRRGGSLRALLRHGGSAVLPALGMVSSQLFYLIGLNYTSPSHSALMYTLLPIFTAILAAALIDDRIGWVQAAGIGVAFVGAFILAAEDGLSFESRYLLGDLITLLAVVGWALFTVLSKPLTARIGSLNTLMLTFAVGIVGVVPLTAISAANQDWAAVGPLAWGGAAYLILGGTLTAYLLYQYSLKRLSAAVVAAFAYSQPVLAALFSVLLGVEVLSGQFYIAAALIIGGLVIARRSPPRVAL